MKIAIVGPGAIGCLFAAHLAEAGNDVALFDRRPDRAALISRRGIRITARGRTRTVAVPATTEPARIRPCDVVCFCVKAFDTAAAARAAIPLFGPHTIAVSLQNGLGNAESLATALPRQAILCAVTANGSTTTAPGEIVHAGWGPTNVAAFEPGRAGDAAAFAGALRAAGLDANALDDAGGMLWSKLIVNAAINPVSALWGVPNGELLVRPELRALLASAAREAQTVAVALHLRLLYPDAAEEAARVCALTRANRSSMLQDLARGAPTEIDAISGPIVAEGHRLGLGVQTNETLLHSVRERGRKRTSPPFASTWHEG
jgi:2-dehydropantoate 2-reductase